MLITLLKKFGVVAEGAINGVDAVDHFKASRDYRLILMDVMMPELDGLGATAQIRNIETVEHLGHAPIIGLTAMDNRSACLAAGMDDYYQKPLLPAQLEELIEKWLSAESLGST